MRGATALGPSELDRERLFFGLFLLATLNAFAGLAIRALEDGTFLEALGNLFGISAILWAALAAGLAILREDGVPTPLRPGDWPVATMIVIAALFPLAPLSAVTLTLAAGWLAATAPPGSRLRRSALIFLAITGSVLWGRLVLAVFSGPLLTADAMFVGQLVGADQARNMLTLPDGSAGIAVAPGCSSMQGLSLAITFWVTVNQLFKVPFGWAALGWCAAALAVAVAFNVVRMGAMLWFPAQFDVIHTGWGATAFGWLTLVLVVAVTLIGARRQVFHA